jgi:hypothetical protein
MKNLVIFAVIFMAMTGAVRADDMYVYFSGGTKTAYPVDELRSLTFYVLRIANQNNINLRKIIKK